MALADLLNSFFGPSQQQAPGVTPPQAGGTDPTTLRELLVAPQRPSGPDVSPTDVTQAGRPAAQSMDTNPALADPISFNPGTSQTAQPPGVNYNNSGDVAAVRAANAQNTPQGGSPNPGVYGLLPQSLQHGTLRNVLGALGDAFLVSGGKEPGYAQNMQRQQIGDAMAGIDINDPDSVRAGAQRVAATGAPGAAEMSDKIMQQAEQAALRKQYMDYNQGYRQQVIDDRTQYHANETEARNQNLLRQRGQAYSGLAVQATTAAQYRAIYDRADASAKQLDPKYSGEDMGLVRPDDWAPGVMNGFGMTGNNVTQSNDRAAQRVQSQTNANIAANSRTASANISANRPSDAQTRQTLTDKINSGVQLTPAEQADYDRVTSVPQHNRRPAPSGVMIGNAQGGAQGGAQGANIGSIAGGGRGQQQQQQFQNNQVYRDAHGNRARYINGRWVPV